MLFLKLSKVFKLSGEPFFKNFTPACLGFLSYAFDLMVHSWYCENVPFSRIKFRVCIIEYSFKTIHKVNSHNFTILKMPATFLPIHCI